MNDKTMGVYLVVISLLLMVCTANAIPLPQQEAETMKTLSGSVFYRERMMLPPDAEIMIVLEDVAKMDVAAEMIAQTRFKPQGGPPWQFSLDYDPAKIHDRGRYALQARIEVDGRLMFINTSQIPAFTPDNTPIDILVSRVASQPSVSSSAQTIPDASLTNTYWKLIEIHGRPAPLGAGQREVNLVLNSENNKAHGFSGCNRYFGGFFLNNDNLQLKQLASTRKACLEGMELENQFLKTLGDTATYAISGDTLTLYNAQKVPVLFFNAIYLH